MGQLLYKLPALLFASLFLANIGLCSGPRTEYKKNINREFTTTSDGKVELTNKYGKVKENTWQNNKVKIDVTIVVNANNEAEANEAFDRISVNFMNMVGLVKAETFIQDQKKSNNWWASWNGNSKSVSCDDFSVNYVVWMPKSNDLQLSNKYGDSDLGSLSGRLDATIKYGDLRAETIERNTTLDIAYGDADITTLSTLTADVAYGELRVKTAEKITLDSKYSDFWLNTVGSLSAKSRYDDFKIGTTGTLRLNSAYSDGRIEAVDDLEIEADYTDIKVEKAGKSVVADLDYSDLRIGSMDGYFEKIDVDGDYSDFSVSFNGTPSFNFDVKLSYGDLRMDYDASYKEKIKESTWKKYIGTVGSGKGAVSVRLSYGDVSIR